MQKLIFSLTIIIVIGFNSNIVAQERPEHKGFFKDELNLTADQEKQFNNIKYEQQKKVLDLKNEIEKNRLEIKNMFVNKNIDEAQIKKLTKRNSELHSQIKDLKVDEWLNVYNLLDDNQKEIWTERFEGICEPRSPRMDRMKGPRGGCNAPDDERGLIRERFNRRF